MARHFGRRDRRRPDRRVVVAAVAALLAIVVGFETNIISLLVNEQWVHAHRTVLLAGFAVAIAASIVVAAGQARGSPSRGGVDDPGGSGAGEGMSPARPASPRPRDAPRADPLWNIRDPVAGFSGRDADLAAIEGQLHHQSGVAGVVVLHGTGGVGKTQLARAYALRRQPEYRLGWWVTAGAPSQILTSLGELSRRLAGRRLPQAEVLPYLEQMLPTYEPWLLIFDNADGPGSIPSHFPRAGGGHTLITSRNGNWSGLPAVREVQEFSTATAAELLARHTGDPDGVAAHALALELGRLPLAVGQAAAYIVENGLRLAEYLKLFRQRRADLLARGLAPGYEDTVAATVTLTVDHLRATNAAACQLVELCALLAPDAIPLAELLSIPAAMPELVASAAADPIARLDLAEALHRAGLFGADVDDTVRIHRLVRSVIVDHLAEPRKTVNDAVALFDALYASRATEEDRLHLLPHLQSLLLHAWRRPPFGPALDRLVEEARTDAILARQIPEGEY